LAVSPGKVPGVIGPNGAAKTTLLDCVAGLLHVVAARWSGAASDSCPSRKEALFYSPMGSCRGLSSRRAACSVSSANCTRLEPEREREVVRQLALAPVLDWAPLHHSCTPLLRCLCARER